MATFNSRGLRGSVFEEMINHTNEMYIENGLAVVQKIPTPITPIEIDNKTRHITLAYFDQKSTVDYIGVVQGIPICFDAKESKTDTFPMQNIHEHQIEFMKRFSAQSGVAFFLIYFSEKEEFYFLSIEELCTFYERMKNGGRKSFRYDELNEKYFFSKRGALLVPYLDRLDTFLTDRG